MKPQDCCLTLVFPKALEENLLDHLLEHPEWVSGFTCSDIQGHGQAISYFSEAELVRGRSHRLQVQIIMNQEDAAALVSHLKESLPNREVVYWITPVLEFGRFA